jgi:hypothetical protein
MAQLSLISFTCAAALAIGPAAAMGQCALGDTCYTLDFSSPTITVTNGILAVSDIIGGAAVSNGATYFDVEGFTGTYTDSASNVTGNISLLIANGWGSDTNEITAVPGWIYDNVFYPGANAPGTSNGYFDVGGLFFYVGPTSPPPTYIANLWAGNIAGEPGSPNTYTIQEGLLGGSNDLGGATGIGMSNSVPLVSPPSPRDPAGAIVFPESSSLSALLLCALCMAGGFFFRARHSGLIRRS